MALKLVKRDEYVTIDELKELSTDEKEFLLFIEENMKECNFRDVSFHPKSFSDPNTDDLEYSYIEIDLYEGDFEVTVYFYKGVYNSWIFSNKIDKKRSGDRNKQNKARAKEKIKYILNEYKTYEIVRFNISKFTDDYYYQ